MIVFVNYSIQENTEFDSEEKRADFAKYVANLMCNDKKSSCPYMPDNKSTFWTVDDGNDWKIKFSDNPNQVEIIHRYNNPDALKALATWIAYRTCGEVQIIE